MTSILILFLITGAVNNAYFNCMCIDLYISVIFIGLPTKQHPVSDPIGRGYSSNTIKSMEYDDEFWRHYIVYNFSLFDIDHEFLHLWLENLHHMFVFNSTNRSIFIKIINLA